MKWSIFKGFADIINYTGTNTLVLCLSTEIRSMGCFYMVAHCPHSCPIAVTLVCDRLQMLMDCFTTDSSRV